jgi:hypothetical protein
MTLWWRAQHAKNPSNTGRWVVGACMIGRERKQGERQRARLLEMCEGGAARERESTRVGRKPLPHAQASTTSGSAASSPARITTSRMSAGIRSTPHGLLKVVRTFLVYTQRTWGRTSSHTRHNRVPCGRFESALCTMHRCARSPFSREKATPTGY